MYCRNAGSGTCFPREIGGKESSIVLNVSLTGQDVELENLVFWSVENGCGRTLPIERLVRLLVFGDEGRCRADMSPDDEDGGEVMGLNEGVNLRKDVVMKHESHCVGGGVAGDRMAKLDQMSTRHTKGYFVIVGSKIVNAHIYKK